MIVKKGKVDYLETTKILIKKRISLFRNSVIITVFGIIFSLLIDNEYTSSTKILPQYSTSNQLTTSTLGDIASIAGFSLDGLESSQNEISPLLYPQIFNSTLFQYKILNAKISYNNKNDYVKKILFEKSKSILDFLPELSFLNANTKFEKKNTESTTSKLTRDEYLMIIKLKKIISIMVNKKEGYFQIVSTYEDPFVAAELTNISTNLLQDYIINLKIKKSKEKLLFIEERYIEIKKDFEDIQLQLAKFKDKNKNISTEKEKIELDRLESQYNISFNLLLNISNEYENQLIQVKEDTPIFTVIEETYIPVIKSYPKRSLIVISFILIGLILNYFYIFYYRSIIKFLKDAYVK